MSVQSVIYLCVVTVSRSVSNVVFPASFHLGHSSFPVYSPMNDRLRPFAGPVPPQQRHRPLRIITDENVAKSDPARGRLLTRDNAADCRCIV